MSLKGWYIACSENQAHYSITFRFGMLLFTCVSNRVINLFTYKQHSDMYCYLNFYFLSIYVCNFSYNVRALILSVEIPVLLLLIFNISQPVFFIFTI